MYLRYVLKKGNERLSDAQNETVKNSNSHLYQRSEGVLGDCWIRQFLDPRVSKIAKPLFEATWRKPVYTHTEYTHKHTEVERERKSEREEE